MKLRPLTPKDAFHMLEWMHDDSVVHHLGTNFAEKTIDDCRRFIDWANSTDSDLHLAIDNGCGEYMGTVSLKHIDKAAGSAEFAVTVRACAMGKGYSHFGMDAILHHGTEHLGLSRIYWCVSQKNARAVRFYDKHGYTRTTDVPQSISEHYTAAQLADFIWYVFE